MDPLQSLHERIRAPSLRELIWALAESQNHDSDGALRLRMLARKRQLSAPQAASRYEQLLDDAVLMAAAIHFLIEQGRRPQPGLTIDSPR
jgi:hypothetical protein